MDFLAALRRVDEVASPLAAVDESRDAAALLDAMEGAALEAVPNRSHCLTRPHQPVLSAPIYTV